SNKIHIAFSSICNHPIVSHIYLDIFYYRKDHVSVAKDIPNSYPIGSTVVFFFLVCTKKVFLSGGFCERHKWW
ncbi:hypothetical protein ACJBSV_11215, partial [Streptococcus suis]